MSSVILLYTALELVGIVLKNQPTSQHKIQNLYKLLTLNVLSQFSPRLEIILNVASLYEIAAKMNIRREAVYFHKMSSNYTTHLY